MQPKSSLLLQSADVSSKKSCRIRSTSKFLLCTPIYREDLHASRREYLAGPCMVGRVKLSSFSKRHIMASPAHLHGEAEELRESLRSSTFSGGEDKLHLAFYAYFLHEGPMVARYCAEAARV